MELPSSLQTAQWGHKQIVYYPARGSLLETGPCTDVDATAAKSMPRCLFSESRYDSAMLPSIWRV